jgi:hypothetical protein
LLHHGDPGHAGSDAQQWHAQSGSRTTQCAIERRQRQVLAPRQFRIDRVINRKPMVFGGSRDTSQA